MRKEGGDARERQRLVHVTGMSGAGRSSALKILEDLGFEAVDNLPLSLLSSLVGPQRDFHRPLAVGIDVRTRDFGVEPLLTRIDALATRHDLDVRVLFLDCDDEVLRRRYTETRHRHPLAGDRPVVDGIALERRLLARIRDRADLLIDTSHLALGDLKRILHGHFGMTGEPGLALAVTSFAYRKGIPREADLVFDVRFLANPHYEAGLRALTGSDAAVADFIAADPGFAPFFRSLTAMFDALIPRYAEEGKSYLTIGIGCTGGRHRSVFVAQHLAEWLKGRGQRVDLYHRDLDQPPGEEEGHPSGSGAQS